MVDGSGLENRHTRKGIRGSNPFLSAITSVVWYLRVGDTRADTGFSEGATMATREVDLTERIQTPHGRLWHVLLSATRHVEADVVFLDSEKNVAPEAAY